MIVFILKRLALVIPMLILLAGILFFFSKNHIVDAVEGQLSSEYVDLESPNYINEYQRIYIEEGFHLPDFYFSIMPRYYHKSINAISHPYRRLEFISSLKDEKFISNLTVYDKLPKIEWHGKYNQFHHQLIKLLTLDFGKSIIDGKLISSKIYSALQWTIFLIVINLIIVVCISFPLGRFLYNNRSLFRQIIESSLFFIYAMPIFWLATIFIVFFTTKEYGSWTDWFPMVGVWRHHSSFFEIIRNNINYLILPVLIMVLHDISFLTIMIKNSISEEAHKPYTLALRAKGLTRKAILNKHIIPNALSPILTTLSSAVPRGIAGSLVIEVIFNIPGMGRLLYTSILQADWNVVYPSVFIIAVMTMIFYLLYDIIIVFMQPQINFYEVN